MENILRQLGSLRSHNIGDVKIVCKDGTVVAHKIILATISGLFQREFSHNFLDETISVIIPDIDRSDVSQCLDVLYNRREVSRDETFINLICGHLPPVAQTDVNFLEETKMEEVENDFDDWDEDFQDDGEPVEQSQTSQTDDYKDEGEDEEPQTSQTVDNKAGPSNVGEKKKGVKRSVVWKHFLLVSKEHYFSICSCLHCGKHVKSYGGTTIRMLTHLRVHHPGYESLDTVGARDQDFNTEGTQSPTIIKFTANKSSPVKSEYPEENTIISDPENFEAEDGDDDDFDFVEDSKKREKPSYLRSVIWRHFTRNEEDRSEAMCHRCGQIVRMSGSSSTHLFRHMKKYHMGRENDILKHFYEGDGSSKSTSTCIHCGHVVKHKSVNDVTPLYGLVLHMVSMHGDIFDRNQYMMNKRMNQEKIEQLPVV